MTLDTITIVTRYLSPVLVHQQFHNLSTTQLLSRLGRPVRNPKYHSSAIINLIFPVSSFSDSSVGHPADVPRGPLTNYYSGHQHTERYLGTYNSATAVGPSSTFMDLVPSTSTNPPQPPASYISWLGNLSIANPLSADAQVHMDTTFLSLPLPTASNELPFSPRPLSR